MSEDIIQLGSQFAVDVGDLAQGLTDTIHELVKAETRRIEQAVRDAIRDGYDGVDVNYHADMNRFGIVSIEPWNYPAPDGANGYRTERYTWDWFSDEELEAILSADDSVAYIDGGDADDE